jgi:hypothetical protein
VYEHVIKAPVFDNNIVNSRFVHGKVSILASWCTEEQQRNNKLVKQSKKNSMNHECNKAILLVIIIIIKISLLLTSHSYQGGTGV